MTGVLIGGEDTDSQGEHQVMIKAEVGVIQLHAKESQESKVPIEGPQEARKESTQNLRKYGSPDTSISDL